MDNHYTVVDSDGKTWAAYCYRAMAENVAARCNADAALDASWSKPFQVRAVQA